MKSSYDIGIERDELEKQQQQAIAKQEEKRIELYKVSREILLLQMKKKDLTNEKEMLDFVVRNNTIELRLKQSEFFNAKNSGI
jgi:hypothetical protein